MSTIVLATLNGSENKTKSHESGKRAGVEEGVGIGQELEGDLKKKSCKTQTLGTE